jgi:phospholipid-binding lipoprotein MlaA
VRCVGRYVPTALALGIATSLAGCAGAPAALPTPQYLPAPQYLAAIPERPPQKPQVPPVSERPQLPPQVPPQVSEPEAKETPDPFEQVNRKIFAGNQALNSAVVYPLANAYRENVPEQVRDRIDAFTTNLSEPMVFANDLLQLRPDAAATTLARFLTNSTVGALGLFDVAATFGQAHQSGDFGQTLYVWGVRDTAYVVLPVLGPSNVRDGIGTGISLLAPFGVAWMVPTKFVAATSQFNTVDALGKPVADLGKVGALQEIEASSVDFYAMLRSVSDQKRQSELEQALSQSLLSAPLRGQNEAARQRAPELTIERDAAALGEPNMLGSAMSGARRR